MWVSAAVSVPGEESAGFAVWAFGAGNVQEARGCGACSVRISQRSMCRRGGWTE